MLPGERRDARAVRFARALLDLVTAEVALGPFAFGRLAVKLEVHGSALHAPRVEHWLAHCERCLVFQLFASGEIDLDVAAVSLARMRVHHFGDRFARLARAERVEPDEPTDTERIDGVLRRQHERKQNGRSGERSDRSADQEPPTRGLRLSAHDPIAYPVSCRPVSTNPAASSTTFAPYACRVKLAVRRQ